MAWAPDYVTVDELAAFVRIPAGDSADAVQLGLAVAAASRAIDRATHRQFGLVAAVEARFYTAHYDRARARWSVPIDDLMTATGLLVGFDTLGDGTYSAAITLHALRPANAAAMARPWRHLVVLPASTVKPTVLEAGVRVTARWGWSVVPEAVRQACLLQASRILTRRDSPYGIAGSPEAGSELRLLAKVDPDVEVALADYKRRERLVWA